jgi:GNAT superfamily N-acetyltransferase
VIFRDARREDVPFIVALLADDVLGAGREADPDDAYWEAFEQIAADPRNRLVVAEAGLGRAMIEWAIGQAREHGCGLVQLTSDKRRPAAVRFYESLGFTVSHEGLKLPL